jgi:hypothetical protein
MIEQSIVYLPDMVKDIDRPVSIYLVTKWRCTNNRYCTGPAPISDLAPELGSLY